MLVLVSISVYFQIFGLNETECFHAVKSEVRALSGAGWIEIKGGRRFSQQIISLLIRNTFYCLFKSG